MDRDTPLRATFCFVRFSVLSRQRCSRITPVAISHRNTVGLITTTRERGMRRTKLFVPLITFISAWLLASCVATGPTPTATAAEPARITVLYDAFGKDATMTKDWGYAALVEIHGKRILFDTGDDPAILAKNAKAKGVDLTKLDFVVLSQGRGTARRDALLRRHTA